MRIYLDMCCFNRPYDPQDQLKIALETQSKLRIQHLIELGKYELIGSYILDYECNNVPVPMRRRSIREFISHNMSAYVGAERSDEISKIAEEIMVTNVKQQDAYHVASAIYAGCSFFITTDIRLLKYKTDKICLINPIGFITEMEE